MSMVHHPSQLPVLVASNHLPVLLERREDGKYAATWRGDRLLASTMAFSHRDLFRPSRRKVRFLGRVELEVSLQDQPAVNEACAAISCIPVFPSAETDVATYDAFCSGPLRAVFHNMVHPSTLNPPSHVQENADPWPAFLAMNKDFAVAISKAYATGDILWLQDFDLVMVPHFLARLVRPMTVPSTVGLFIHVPFPSKSVLSTLSHDRDILRSMLTVHHVGFHIYEHARHFLDACEALIRTPPPSMIQGQLVVHHNGKQVHITCAQLTVDAARVERDLASNDSVRDEIIRWRQLHKLIFAAVDVVDELHGIPHKVVAFHQFLKKRPEYASRVLLVQVGVVTSTLGSTQHAQEVRRLVDDINAQYPTPVIVFDVRNDRMPTVDRIALWRVAEVFVSTVFAEGLNTCPFEYLVTHRNATGLAILSQFAVARRILHGATIVNPWNIHSIATAMEATVHMSLKEKEFRRDCDVLSIASHTPTRWAATILSDIAAAASAPPKKLDVLTKPLTVEHLLDLYYKSRGRRIFFFDYYRTLAPDVSSDFGIVWPDVPVDVLSSLEQLCRDPRNTVFVVSGCNCELLSDKFGSVPGLGLVAEHGYFIRWAMLGRAARINKPWELYGDVFRVNASCGKWREKAEAIMLMYVDRTNGAALEMRRSSILFRYASADYGFGLLQARELLHQLTAAFDGWPLSVIQGKDYIEVRPEGLGKGKIVKQILHKLHMDSIKSDEHPASSSHHGAIDFVWTMGDDVADELMFDAAHDCGHAFNIAHGTIHTVRLIYIAVLPKIWAFFCTKYAKNRSIDRIFITECCISKVW
ncbi:trehalose-phosphatase, variant 3 [Aphanomyces astaci]|uniref:Trehalose-phosphatase, variant 3 n=1 Tax=Aphanomyces astaci TaxID=112090 RepID=W4FXS4_APHAT|nr:trehalose-phosphatase, variant 3 [Aphanomyces astaci]ETV71761.1 trehalose-phosphatase, variant 3 [Aphanomyces astaci]|eukprot:XP_009838608.1 trehalose-phosphatase, variant 3 [Aphanomyces astaci]